VSAQDFFRGTYTTALRPDELLIAAEIPRLRDGYCSAFREFTRRLGDFATAGVAVHGSVAKQHFADLRVVLFGVHDRPTRACKMERELENRPVTTAGIRQALSALDADLSPIGDIHATAAAKHIWRACLQRGHWRGLATSMKAPSRHGRRLRHRHVRERIRMVPISESADISLTVNGRAVRRHVLVRVSLADFLRQDLGLTGTHVGCEQGVCGACTLMVDSEIVRSCLMFAVQADGCSVETIEGLSDSGRIRNLQDAFVQHNGVQCGFCTPGMLMAAQAFIEARAVADSRTYPRLSLGNYCRCTGYQAIIDQSRRPPMAPLGSLGVRHERSRSVRPLRAKEPDRASGCVRTRVGTLKAAAASLDDIVLGSLVRCFLSALALRHARIAEIETGAAAKMPGVICIANGAE